MSIQIKSDKKETETKTIRFPTNLLKKIEKIMLTKDVSFSGFVIQACEYVIDELEKEKTNNE